MDLNRGRDYKDVAYHRVLDVAARCGVRGIDDTAQSLGE